MILRMYSRGTEALVETGKYTKLEKLLDNKLMEHVKSAKYVPPYGIETLAGYLIAKDNEIKIARIILAGNSRHIAGTYRERLRETYV